MAVKVGEECIGCGSCVDTCPCSALEVVNDKAVCDEGACAECGACIDACPVSALTL
ncbi:MAG: 4Fe-4S binding protein [Planctomycetia bacterium]|nr:4Fe-4S binding protein [Planctomycetia bacterium]